MPKYASEESLTPAFDLLSSLQDHIITTLARISVLSARVKNLEDAEIGRASGQPCTKRQPTTTERETVKLDRPLHTALWDAILKYGAEAKAGPPPLPSAHLLKLLSCVESQYDPELAADGYRFRAMVQAGLEGNATFQAALDKCPAREAHTMETARSDVDYAIAQSAKK